MRGRLLAEFMKQGCLPKFESGNSPHITLLYDKRLIPEHAIEPVRWTAGEIVLVESHVGEGRYSFLGRWNLGG
jgi:2'-5' RNA ligase